MAVGAKRQLERKISINSFFSFFSKATTVIKVWSAMALMCVSVSVFEFKNRIKCLNMRKD